MKVIILITCCCYLLYKSGSMKKLLRGFEIEPDPIPEPQHPPEPQEGRQKWAVEAAYILKQQGQNPETVKYMGDEMLIAIRRDYLRSKGLM